MREAMDVMIKAPTQYSPLSWPRSQGVTAIFEIGAGCAGLRTKCSAHASVNWLNGKRPKGNKQKAMKQTIEAAFAVWRDFITSNQTNPRPGLIVHKELSPLFQSLALNGNLNEIFDTGQMHGFAPVSIINMLILHGGYFRLLHAGVIK
jgi:hypothetical protein